jgi:hypothetical protein
MVSLLVLAMLAHNVAGDASGRCADGAFSCAAPADGAYADEAELLRVQLLQASLEVQKVPQAHGEVQLMQASPHLPSTTVPSSAEDRAKQVAAEVNPGASEMTTDTTTPDATGMTLNAVGDFEAFVSALIVSIGSVVFMIGVFSFLRLHYPIMYSHNILQGFAPGGLTEPPPGYFGWVRPVLDLKIEDVAEKISLDHAMLLEFCNLCMKILAAIGAPMIFVMGSMNYFFGGRAAGEDHLSYLSFGNVCAHDAIPSPDTHCDGKGSWLYWIHALCVWGVVLFVQSSIYKAQEVFLKLRFKWLQELPELRANTIMVEEIPEAYRSDDALKAFFTAMLPHTTVTEVHLARDTTVLHGLVSQKTAATAKLQEAEAIWQKAGQKPDAKPTVREPTMGAKVDSIDFWTKQIEQLSLEIKQEQARIKEASHQIGGVNVSSGFVTFSKREDAEVALRLTNISADMQDWTLSTPPHPDDVIWADLTQDDVAQNVRTLVGYGLVAGLYFAYMPMVIGITNIAKMINMGMFQPIWEGVAPTMGLQFMVAMLPTFLNLIFKSFFTLRGSTWAQSKLQVWYFWFQVVFVILAAAIGQNVRGFTQTLIEEPLQIFGVFASTMPYATHFFMNFLVLSWTTHAMIMTRYFPLIKFRVAAMLFDEEASKNLAEPEDQDYYGIGARSSRWTIMMCISIVFGTLSPPINLFGFINFAVCRLVYGYLFCFAETRKTDLGGVFWVTALEHLFVGMIIYCILMTGVLLQRAEYWTPGVMVAPSIGYVIWSLGRFKTAFSWEKLPFTTLLHIDGEGDDKTWVKKTMKSEYIQPELLAR